MNPVRKFWESCRPQYAHLRLGENHIFYKLYDENILNHFRVSLKDKVIIDYGCGGAILAHRLMAKGIRKYIGIDISERSRIQAKRNTAELGIETEFHPENADLSKFNADVLFCFAVIQHFESERYLSKFLQRLNRSGIKHICLHIRHASQTRFNNAYAKAGDVGRACHTNPEYIARHMPAYVVTKATEPQPQIDSQGIILRLKK